jgi:hypothetical protein
MRVKFRGSIRVIRATRRVRDGQNEWWKRKLQEKPPSLRFRTFTVFSKRTLFETHSLFPKQLKNKRLAASIKTHIKIKVS